MKVSLRQGKSIVIGLLCAVASASVVILAFAILFPPFARSGDYVPASYCKNTICALGINIVAYADANGGRLPSEGWGSSNDCPKWFSIVNSWCLAKGREIWDGKCQSDTSTDRISYDLNHALAGKNINDIPMEKRAKIVLLTEKHNFKSHGWVCFLDCHVERLGKR